jgi:hypothetical protein
LIEPVRPIGLSPCGDILHLDAGITLISSYTSNKAWNIILAMEMKPE